MTGTDRFFRLFAWGMGLFCVLFLLLPIAITLVVSFSGSPVYTLPPPDWSLRWYLALAEHVTNPFFGPWERTRTPPLSLIGPSPHVCRAVFG